ncbi:hypothetical protein BOTBODRAFT_453198 [Botryobasidium botryosum FD-172 SS1]|uniref:Uncharacterized protein n=1 Tax=Botryobasidium botryosum (strain FD-172 SS1) TaxID=930990 RepID=A0A067MJ35_BOTB1|nr:hypothetical protein BOTBODRAFT_453198 [Botryobasidium botryosum FD-172 SS1]
MNLDETRRIAFSQFDAIRDQIEVWRTEPEMFIGGLLERAASTIVSDDTPAATRVTQARMDAFRSRLHISHLQYAAWSRASSWFNEISVMGLNSPSAVLSALKKDDEFLGRTVGMVLMVIELEKWLDGKVSQELTSSDYLRPFFIRTRAERSATIVPNPNKYFRPGSLEWLLGQVIPKGGVVNLLSSMHELWPLLQKPSEARKVSAAAFDTLGDHGIASEFAYMFDGTTFGMELKGAPQKHGFLTSQQCLKQSSIYPGRKSPERSCLEDSTISPALR